MNRRVVLEACGVKKGFVGTEGSIDVLKGVDLSVSSGEVVSIIGASGVGKSTLLQILGSLDTPDAGIVRVHGRDLSTIRGRELNELRNRVIGFIFQFHFLLPEFTAVENVAMPGMIGRKARRVAESEAKELLARVGLEQRFDHRPGELSGGEQQRVAVARALANHPEVILADEPTGNLDDTTGAALHDLIRELSTQENQAFVVVTHKKEFARRADREFELREGVLHALKD